MKIGAWSTTPITLKIPVVRLASMRKRSKRMNSLIREALVIAIENWEYDGEYEKVNQASDLLRKEEK